MYSNDRNYIYGSATRSLFDSFVWGLGMRLVKIHNRTALYSSYALLVVWMIRVGFRQRGSAIYYIISFNAWEQLIRFTHQSVQLLLLPLHLLHQVVNLCLIVVELEQLFLKLAVRLHTKQHIGHTLNSSYTHKTARKDKRSGERIRIRTCATCI